MTMKSDLKEKGESRAVALVRPVAPLTSYILETDIDMTMKSGLKEKRESRPAAFVRLVS